LKWISINWHYVPGHEGIEGNERCDEIAVAFTKEDHDDLFLYHGKPDNYCFDILAAPPPHPLPEMRFGAPPSGKSEDNFYLSSVGGIIYRHKTWASCERRVKGVPQAKFKKLKGENEVPVVLTSWGISGDANVLPAD
ncbi:MAG: viroplasmin family protein, partial [Bdellovibrionota bacterium]